LINRGIASLWQAGRAGKALAGVREVEFFSNADDTKLLIEVLCAPEARRAAVRGWAEELCASMPEIVGVAAFHEPKKGVRELLVTVGEPVLTYQTKAAAYRVSAGAFFQTNRFLTDELIGLVTAGRSGEVALDLYAGVGLFSTALAGDFRHIISVETSQTSAVDLKYNLPANGKAVQTAAEQYLDEFTSVGRTTRDCAVDLPAQSHSDDGKKREGYGAVRLPPFNQPDLVIVDPPRSGLGDRVARALARVNAPRITYVSCDPATLARDLLPLQAAGYGVEEIHLVDLFPQTYHLETVMQLVRR
jgi:23S rRNA (uracil1939-C5)-methyltransferase